MDSSKTPDTTTQSKESVSLKPETTGNIVSTSEPSSLGQVQEIIEPVFDFLGKLPDELGNFLADYKKPLITLLIFASGIVSVYVVLSVINAINDIPLLSPILELVGLGYSVWFVYRYLLRASTRSELVQEFEVLKKQVVGKNTQDK
jgi:hypothetical protein